MVGLRYKYIINQNGNKTRNPQLNTLCSVWKYVFTCRCLKENGKIKLRLMVNFLQLMKHLSRRILTPLRIKTKMKVLLILKDLMFKPSFY